MHNFGKILKKSNSFLWLERAKRNEGIAIYLAVAVLSVVLAVALGVSMLSVGQMKNINQSGNSVVAFAAAETGIEWALYPWYSGQVIDTTNYQAACPLSGGQYVCPVPSGGVLGGAFYTVTALTNVESALCPVGFLCIKSVGKYLDTQRVIMVQL